MAMEARTFLRGRRNISGWRSILISIGSRWGILARGSVLNRGADYNRLVMFLVVMMPGLCSIVFCEITRRRRRSGFFWGIMVMHGNYRKPGILFFDFIPRWADLQQKGVNFSTAFR